jgi:hypothetical protein
MQLTTCVPTCCIRLQANQGNVERTIEQLLASGDADAASADIPLEIQPDALPETAVDAQIARRLTHDWYAPSTPKSVVASTPRSTIAQQQYAQTGASTSHRGTIVTLPDTFLRVPGWRTKGQDSASLQMAEDERVAMMLQVKFTSQVYFIKYCFVFQLYVEAVHVLTPHNTLLALLNVFN